MSHDDPDAAFLHAEADLAAFQRKWHFLDAVACELHNHGHNLDGNTAESDLEWFARHMWEERWGKPPRHWEVALNQDERDYWIRTAQAALAALPGLQARIASRCIALSKSVRMLSNHARGVYLRLARQQVIEDPPDDGAGEKGAAHAKPA